ncbi:hypothetical protein PHYSODRAFT_516107 [Phytophthora sojae]|uniref:Uncharacterized protein n=1 Tax=Phytophthora sojae (strain P6497) TaxID=1094619 RepID=G4ZX77_PHYSP|nr:hypothetical protein PHYSODRAFT_516107 [Phytophthora sojae]EGZ11794.1 hypothetical protein PHYSODRAFT_516107 [Phytophthora sojae]|eukprot:XP_009532127.1 hypothetical protein PHYSODRAFT_516107 [Phytophthora sojae]
MAPAGGPTNVLSRILSGDEHRGDSAKQQFRPTSVAWNIHNRSVSSKYSALTPDVYLELLQCDCQSLLLLPHPAVLRRFFSLDFGQRGLSIRHFRLLSTLEARELLGGCSLVFGNVVSIACSPDVGRLVEHARAFVSTLIRNRVAFDNVAVEELAYWVDERFEVFRSLLAQGENDAANIVIQ